MRLGHESYERTRDGDLVAFGSNPPDRGEPQMELKVNGVAYYTASTSVRGCLGGCRIAVDWDGRSSLSIMVDPPQPKRIHWLWWVWFIGLAVVAGVALGVQP
jgi:hypothetical protein